MKKRAFNFVFASMCVFGVSQGVAQTNPQCLDKSFTLQLLGSGGPITDDARASAGELIWIDGKSKILIDAGGGTYLRFGQSGARLEDLDSINMTHFHADHSADIPAILKGAYFSKRTENLPFSGPTHSGLFPSATDFLQRVFGKDHGAFAYLHGILTGTDGFPFKLDPVINIDYTKLEPTKVFSNDEFTVWALGIPKGDVPTLAYKIVSKKGTIVVTGAGGSNEHDKFRDAFIKFAKNADILMMPMPIDESADAAGSFLHAKPSVIGQVAAAVNPKALVLSHFLGKGLVLKDESTKIVKKYYKGPVYEGRDLACFPVNGVK
ncbi:MBL fold metallo-hydrolase [Francisella tularensis]|uniref:MBL fold metallo-hydrolase n=1 Tax=Francisella tularensis TaxID=263 RepID=UPI00018553B5|nr:MBL fold metallo-hydrolase [Francisella tularensis]EDZ90630.1 metallo-beta-lactamase superfamily protein, putative [Francisella tularensis subsp. novicida FTG]MBK2335356.1 MBL fold metallo-hydrolase [Francisella tularensis subsp. novicida]